MSELYTTDNVVLRIECQIKNFYCKRKFSLNWTVSDLRVYFEQLLDIDIENIILKLNNNVKLTNDNFKLAELNLKTNDLIFIDSVNRVDDIDDVNELPDKYQMSDKDYDKRQNTLRKFLKENKLGKYSGNLNLSYNNSNQHKRLELESIEKLKLLKIGQEVNVCEPNKPLRTANIQYVGILRGIREPFIGVIFDEPVGDSNGQDGCIRYFDAKRKHASFVRPEYIQIRDNIEQSSGTDSDDIKLD